MQIKQKVSRSFIRLSPKEKLVRYQMIHGRMSSVASFNAPPITYAVLQTQLDDLKAKLLAAETKAIGTTEALHQSEAKIDVSMQRLALYVESIALGDPVVIENSGFSPTAGETSPAALPDNIVYFDYIVQKQSGSVELNIKSLGGGKSVTYILGVDLDDISVSGNLIDINVPKPSRLYIVTDTQAKTLITGLPADTRLQVRCYTTNSAGNSQLSDSIRFRTN
jgi:hypothetical protein